MSSLWPTAREIIRWLFNIFGEPQDIAARNFLDRKSHDLLLTWIRAGETLLRRILLIDALAQTGAPTLPPARDIRKQRQRKLVEFFPEKPDDWRVAFHACLTERRLPAGNQHKLNRPNARASLPLSPWPLALRAEALLRVCNNPAPYIARMARFIARCAKAIVGIRKAPYQRKRRSGDPPHIIDIIGRETWASIEAATPDTG